jgi:hypothetical protein
VARLSGARRRVDAGGGRVDDASLDLLRIARPPSAPVGIDPVMRRGKLRRTLLHAIAGPLALVLLAGTAAAAPSDTKLEISDAQRHLAALEAQISAAQAHVLAVQASMNTLAAKVGTSRRLYEGIQARLKATGIQRAQVQARYQAIRTAIGNAAADAYRRGPGYGFEALMELDSLTDATYVLGYTNAITRHNSELAAQAQMLAAELKKRALQESDLMSRSGRALDRLKAAQSALTRSFVEEQVRLADLAHARAQVGSILIRLRAQLRAEEIAAAEEALRHGTPMSFGKWASYFLQKIHAPVARNNLVVMVAWEAAEYTTARWNPLATTYPMPGSSTFNSSRVRNYSSLAQGLEATRRTLRESGDGYEAILADLARDAESMTTAKAINASRWCRGCANGGYVVDLIASVEQYYDHYANSSA